MGSLAQGHLTAPVVMSHQRSGINYIDAFNVIFGCVRPVHVNICLMWRDNMFLLTRTMGPYYEESSKNIAISKSKDALEVLIDKDRQGLEEKKKESIRQGKINVEYNARVSELEGANPFLKDIPPGCPECTKIPVTRKEHRERRRLKLEAEEALQKWAGEVEKHYEPYHQQAREEMIETHNLPIDYEFGYYRPAWMYGKTIEVQYNIGTIKEV